MQSIEIKVSPKEAEEIDIVKLKVLAVYGKQAYVRIDKKSLDARSKFPFYTVRATVFDTESEAKLVPPYQAQDVSKAREIHIIGAGPAGLFAALECIQAGLKPVIIERGKAVKERRRDLAILNKDLIVNPDSNYCFGEGGAGTYSDGKLYTRSKKRGDVLRVLEAFVQFGAAHNILYDSKPHIGTNKLPGIITQMRDFIEECGGEVHFDTRLEDIDIKDGSITKLVCNGGVSMPCKELILATGHSARDIFELLYRKGVDIEAKPFALGVRIEHPQEMINQMQYRQANTEYLPSAYYNIVEQVNGAGVFSFCMCPGGIIASSATNAGEVVVNGWSPSKRNGKFANSGFVTQVGEEDFRPFSEKGPLSGMAFQAHWEQQCFAAEKSIVAPAQRMEDFISGKTSSTLPECSYIPGVAAHNLFDFLPQRVGQNLSDALKVIGKSKPWYRSNEAIMVATESRTSSPVRIPRTEDYHHPQIKNLYPCAEGAGYAGGILSAALDGINCLKAIPNEK